MTTQNCGRQLQHETDNETSCVWGSASVSSGRGHTVQQQQKQYSVIQPENSHNHIAVFLLNVSPVIVNYALKSVPKFLHLPLDKVLRDHQRPVSPHPSREQVDVRHPHVPLDALFEGSPAAPVQAVQVRRASWPLSSSLANHHHSKLPLHLVADPSLSSCCSVTPSSVLNPNSPPKLVFCVC